MRVGPCSVGDNAIGKRQGEGVDAGKDAVVPVAQVSASPSDVDRTCSSFPCVRNTDCATAASFVTPALRERTRSIMSVLMVG